MTALKEFEFDRSRGIVWVCDLANSSKYLNDNKSADELEKFLPRLYWTALAAVDAADGKFIKWTGDGFLTWFEVPLHRTLGEKAAMVFDAAAHLTFIVNNTQLGSNPERKFRLRHGVAYEQDALLMKIKDDGGESLDLIGRAVVLAFRLSGISAISPGIVTQRELVNAYSKTDKARHRFMKWDVSTTDKLKYFKGERWSTESIYVSSNKLRMGSKQSILRNAKKTIDMAEGRKSNPNMNMEFANKFLNNMLAGPDWCREVVAQHVRAIKEDWLGTLKSIVSFIEKFEEAKRKNQIESDGTA